MTTTYPDLQEIRNCILASPPEEGVGLLTGESGKGLYALCEVLANTECKEAFVEYLENVINYCLRRLSEDEIAAPLSLAEGLPGTCILLNLLKKEGLLDKATTASLYELENLLLKSVNEDKNIYSQLGYDYFYGLTGLGTYFLTYSSHSKRKSIIKKICSQLIRAAISDSNGLRWKDDFHFGTQTYNLGIAHGILSVIVFFSKVIQHSLGDKDLVLILHRTVQWFLKQENDNNHLFRFSCTVGKNGEGRNSNNRLAWCYGELTIVICLIHAYKATKEEAYFQKALSIALTTVEKRGDEFVTRTKNGLYEGGLCHGIAGISYAYFVISRYFNNQVFFDCHQYWEGLLNERSPHSFVNNAAGFYKITLVPESEPEIQPKLSLIDGAAGGGLYILTVAHPEIESIWAPIFSMDIL